MFIRGFLPFPFSRLVLALLLWGSVSIFTSTGAAHETDNFNLPLDVEFADLGDYVETLHTRAIEGVVEKLNARIERAGALKNPATREKRIAECHDPATVAAEFAKQFGDSLSETFRAERAIRGSWAAAAYPGKTTSRTSIRLNFTGHPALDPRRVFMLSQSDTLKAFGVYFGTDKLTHFHKLGSDYFQRYTAILRRGVNPEEAYRQVLQTYGRTTLLSESNIFGTYGTGVYSNADMCVNLMGFKFYQNLTGQVVLKGKLCQPLIVRSGNLWRVNHQVRPQSGWFAAYVSDHWNEALNPSLYDRTMRARIRKQLTGNAANIIAFYTKKDARPNNAAYFENLALKLSTYYGENYRHSGEFDQLMNIGNTCYPALRDRGIAPAKK